MNVGRVALPGTCGELVQGHLDGLPFLVSCPIDRWATVEVQLSGQRKWDLPPATPKTMAGIRAAARFLGCPDQGGMVTIRSSLPRGKGYASSTADVAGAVFALALALGRSIDPRAVARLALGVEPSDSIMFPGLAVLDHRTGRWSEPLGDAPPLALVVVDEGGVVDTVAFNGLAREAAFRGLSTQHREALEAVRHGLHEGDLAAIGHGATLSALAQQQILPKALLPIMLQLCRDTGGLGLCAAHSGTLLGLLLDPVQHDTPDIALYIRRHLPPSARVDVRRMVGGGPRVGQWYPTEDLCIGGSR